MSRFNKLLKIIFWATLVIFPLGQIPKLSLTPLVKISLLDGLIGLFVGLTFLAGFKYQKAKKALIFRPGVIFIIIAGLSLLVNFWKTPPNLLLVGFLYLLRFGLYFLFYLGLRQVNFSQKTLDWGLLISGFLVAFLGILQYILYPDLRNLIYLGWDPHFYRLFSTFFDPNFTGVILVLTLFQLFFLYKTKTAFKTKIMFLLAFIVLSASIFLTRSRTAYLSLLIGSLVMFWKLRKIKISYLLILLVVFFLAAKLPTPKVDVFDLFRVTSSVSRIGNWKNTLIIGLKQPVLGQGFGTLRFPDSSLLAVWATTGILGVSAFCWLLWRILRFGLKKTEVLVVLVVLFVSSWFNNTLFYPWILYWFFVFLAGSEAVTVRK